MKAFVKGALVLSAFGAILSGCNGSDDDGGPSTGATATATGTANATASGTASATGTASGTGTPRATATAGSGPDVTAVALVSVVGPGTTQSLYVFNARRPSQLLRSSIVSGLGSNVTLRGIDYRPANRALYGIGSNNVLYVIDASSGVARAVGGGFSSQVSLSGSNVGFDFNPVPDRIRVVTDSGLNFRLNPNTGGAVDGNANVTGFQRDANLSFAQDDANSGRTPRVTAAAYSNSVAGATATTNYAIDSATNSLVTQGTLAGKSPIVSPNVGILFTVGSLGVSGITSFDIGRNDVALAASSNTLYQVNLSSGRATGLGAFNNGLPGSVSGGTFVGLAIVPSL